MGTDLVFNDFDIQRNLAIAPSNNQIVYAATYNRIRRSDDLGGEWKEITYDLPSNSGSIEAIVVKPDDPKTVWVALSGFYTSGVYQLVNDSAWINISDGLPPIPIYTLVQNQHADPVELFAGTELGIYYKKGDEPWKPYVNGLPNVRIGELEMYYSPIPGQSRLRAATYGRGLWESPVPEGPAAGVASSNSPVCYNSSGILSLFNSYGSIQWEQSADGVSGWENVIGGNGENSATYITPELTATAFYRALVTQPGFEDVYSDVLEILIMPLPGDAGPISGPDTVCQYEHKSFSPLILYQVLLLMRGHCQMV